MPYVSRAQQAWAHTKEGTKALGGEEKVAEWDAASEGKKLPARKKKSPQPAPKPVAPVVRMRHTAKPR